MGQYFMLVNIDKNQFVHPHQIGNGLKIGEQRGWKYSTETVVALLTKADRQAPDHELVGSWSGDRIGFVGDYGGSHPANGPLTGGILLNAEALYNVDEDPRWANISPAVRQMMSQFFGIEYRGDGWLEIYENGEKVLPFMTPDFVVKL